MSVVSPQSRVLEACGSGEEEAHSRIVSTRLEDYPDVGDAAIVGNRLVFEEFSRGLSRSCYRNDHRGEFPWKSARWSGGNCALVLPKDKPDYTMSLGREKDASLIIHVIKQSKKDSNQRTIRALVILYPFWR